MVSDTTDSARGIAYESVAYFPGGRETYLGIYDTATDSFTEALLPADGYVHVGFDPAGRFEFAESAGERHELLAVNRAADGSLRTSLLRRLSSPAHDDQRHHAHPFLAADRKRLYFTDWSAGGFAQVCAMDVGDLVAAADRG